MTATMAERVGTCILNCLERHNCLPGSDLGERGLVAMDITYAVFEAMREPSGAIHRAGHSPLVPHFAEEAEAYAVAERVWKTMIDAALAEHGPRPTSS